MILNVKYVTFKRRWDILMHDDSLTNLSKKIKQALFDANLTQKELSRKVGISQHQVSNLVCGGGSTKFKTLKKIARATNKPLSYFIDDSQTNISTGDNVVIGKNHNVNSGVNSKEALEIELLKKEVENLKLKMDLMLEKEKKKK
jgi:transcriptional regulator with XRE-family HTH domain